jgi:hypothetical protein
MDVNLSFLTAFEYRSLDAFLENMRFGTLREDFTFSSDVWGELITRINADQEFAKEVLDQGTLLFLSSSSSEMEDVLLMAEVCSHG